MHIMSASDLNTDENQDLSKGDSSWYILDETGDTDLGPLPKHVLLPEQFEEPVEDSAGTSDESTLRTEETKDVLLTVENKQDLSVTQGDGIDLFSSTLIDDVDDMKKCQRFPSTPRRRRGTKKRKRRTGSTPNQTPLSSSKPNLAKKRKNSAISIEDSDDSIIEINEPEASVIEINDDSSVIVLSDDEVGICSGTVTKPIQNDNKKQRSGNEKVGVPPKSNSPGKDRSEKNSELYQPMAERSEEKTGLRPIIIDGCNVAFGHGRDRFSSLGLKICVDYFKKLGHEVRVFIPQFRKHHNATTNPELLDEMEKEGTLCYTPSRRTDGKMIVSYDDRFIVQYADANGGVIVSRDNYRDLLNENPEWKETINKRLLMYTWVGDTIMFPKDPLGRHGPTLQDFLKF